MHKPGSKGWGKTNVIRQLSIPLPRKGPMSSLVASRAACQGGSPTHIRSLPGHPPARAPGLGPTPPPAVLSRGEGAGACPLPVRPGTEPGHLSSSRVTVMGWGACRGVGVDESPSPAPPRPSPPTAGGGQLQAAPRPQTGQDPAGTREQMGKLRLGEEGWKGAGSTPALGTSPRSRDGSRGWPGTSKALQPAPSAVPSSRAVPGWEGRWQAEPV